MDINLLLNNLNAHDINQRLDALRTLVNEMKGNINKGCFTNNHVHSKYSFSPYSPSKIVFEAYKNGLAAIGIMDHDSIGGAREFIEAGKIAKIPTTVGAEIRTDWSNTQFRDITINNPNQKACVYTCIHGIKEDKIDEVDDFLSPIRRARNERNRKMVENLNRLIPDIKLDFEKDVMNVSYASDGGSITERHILLAAANTLIEIVGKKEKLINYFNQKLTINLNDKQKAYLMDDDCDIYEYDIINILKANYLNKIYVDAQSPEIPDVFDAIKFAHKIDAIIAYVYSGDVINSITEDKKNQKFEDDFIEDLFKYNKSIGFDAVAFMPTRNTEEQLDKVMNLCRKNDLIQINGEDINQPRQPFVCEKLSDKKYAHLIDTTWDLVNRK